MLLFPLSNIFFKLVNLFQASEKFVEQYLRVKME